MLLQSGLVTFGDGNQQSSQAAAAATVSSPAPKSLAVFAAPAPAEVYAANGPTPEVASYLDVIQDTLKEGWTVHTAKDGRLYYCNHITTTASWLPPSENWGRNIEFPYGWEKAVDSKGRPYYINHLNKCTTYEAPEVYRRDDKPPEPRLVVLTRSPKMGFGFVAGSERPVIVRFVTEGGPSVNKLEPGDRILEVNKEDVQEAPRDHVIQLVRACESQVSLLVCQPLTNGCAGRKSTLLSATKKAKLRSRPTRVRFAESVCVNGAPLFPPSAFSLGDLCVPPMANVLKVFLENGQTKSFKYDNTTTVQDVVTSLRDKLCLSAEEHFSLVLEHVKSLKRNKLTLLDPQETLARIAARPGAHKLRCLFRVTFVPISAAQLAQRDLNALDYLHMQCCNDVTQERFAPELQPEVALRLAALHIHQHSLANNISPAKLTVKTVEREFGLERFVPWSLIDGMKRKELRRLMAHFLKLNSQMTGSSKMLTQLQAKIHYLDIISGLPSYGAKCFSTNQRDGIERVLLVSPRFGLSQIAGTRNSVPTPICSIEHLTRITITREDDVTHCVSAYVSADKFVTFAMDDRDAVEFALVLAGYYRLLADKLLPIEREPEEFEDEDNSPPYVSQHTVVPAAWSYLSNAQTRAHCMAFLTAPPYLPVHQLVLHQQHQASAGQPADAGDPSDGDRCSSASADATSQCDRNMNTTMSSNRNHSGGIGGSSGVSANSGVTYALADGPAVDDFGFDMQSVIAMEILEGDNAGPQQRLHQLHHPTPPMQRHQFHTAKPPPPPPQQTKHPHQLNGLIETRNEEVLRRVAEMQRMVESSAKYLNEQGELVHEYEMKVNTRLPWKDNSLDGDSDSGSMSSSKVSSNEDANSGTPAPGSLKHSDSLVLLTDAINLDLNGMAKGLTTLGSSDGSSASNGSVQNTPQVQRRTQGLSQLLSDLHALSNDLSQSESDSESVSTPNSSPIHRNHPGGGGGGNGKPKVFRSSFGLHSPDTLGPDTKDTNLRDYLRQLKEASCKEDNEDIDLAAKKLSELYGFEIVDETFINSDPDVIDLTAIPPPQTPDELDALGVISAAPSGFADCKSGSSGDFEKFLARVTVAPPMQRITPAKELTPEEIMSYIIPPPPGLGDDVVDSENRQSIGPGSVGSAANEYAAEDLYMNSSGVQAQVNCTARPPPNRVIDYATLERTGSFSCCAKSKKPTTENCSTSRKDGSTEPTTTIPLPPRRCPHSNPAPSPPERPPKQSLPSPSRSSAPSAAPAAAASVTPAPSTFRLNGGGTGHYYSVEPPPRLPPRAANDNNNMSPLTALPPRKPSLPPTIPAKPILRNGHDHTQSPTRLVGIAGSPFFNRHAPLSPQLQHNHHHPHMYPGSAPSSPPVPAARLQASNGGGTLHHHHQHHHQTHQPQHIRSFSDCPPVNDAKLSLLGSPQLSRRIPTSPQQGRSPSPLSPHTQSQHSNVIYHGSPLASPSRLGQPTSSASSSVASSTPSPLSAGMAANVPALLAKTDVAMAGLLVRLDQIAGQCSAAQAAGGGVHIDEARFQAARSDLTEQALSLVTASKLLVMSMSEPVGDSFPAHLTTCLTALRRVTELAQDMTKHTTAPLQTRNIVLKIHDVAAMFRELAGVETGPAGAGPLALQAECLANVLATLLRSLRVFST